MSPREFTEEENRILREALRTDKRDTSKQSSKDEQHIAELAKLSPLKFAQCSKQEAKDLGITLGELNKLVKMQRARNENDVGQGRPVKITDVEPWSEPIEGERVASALAVALRQYIVLPEISADAIALWVLHTWLVNCFFVSPRLALTSPTKGCGKTTVLRFLNQVTRRPKRAGSITPAALFRVVEQCQPTIILDETEKYIEPLSEFHALLNEGHCKGSSIIRVLGEKNEMREFEIFGAVAFARNGRMPDDLEQRSIVIEMERRRAEEKILELREDRCGALQNLARMCARWTGEAAEVIAGHDPNMGGLFNRVADNWRPLFTIADMIGSDWPERARQAAAALMPKESEAVGPMVLADIGVAFADKDRMWSETICTSLATMEGRPWAEWSKGKPITPNQLARLLKACHVHPELVRVGGEVKRGYHRHQFGELWIRYGTTFPGEGSSNPLHPYKDDETCASHTAKPLQADFYVTVRNCEKSNNDAICNGVTVEKGVSGENREIRLGDEPEAERHDDPELVTDTTSDTGPDDADTAPTEFGSIPKDTRAQVEPPADDLTIPPNLDRRPKPRQDGPWPGTYPSDDDIKDIEAGKFK